MRAILCEEPGRLALVERPEPEPRAGEVVVRIRRAGVCGTDLHIFEGTHPYLEYPRVMGHELAGEVAAAPAGSAFKAGQLVVVIPYLACGRCIACRKGKTNCCQHLSVFGVHRDGGFCDYLAVPEGNLLPVDDLSLDEAAMVEFLAIGSHGIGRAGLKSGERVLVVGAGPIGIAAMIFARAREARITALDVRADRLAFARERLGAEHAIEAGGEVEKRLAGITEGDFYDLVIDATGHAPVMEQNLAYVAHGGTYLLLGITQSRLAFPDPELHKREASLLASRNATRRDFEEVLALMRAGRVPVAALASHRAPLDEIPGTFPAWLRPETGVIKALIEV